MIGPGVFVIMYATFALSGFIIGVLLMALIWWLT